MLLMLDDETGAVAGADTLHCTLGGAALAELALQGRVETVKGDAGVNDPRVVAAGDGALSDPLLQTAYANVAPRPQDVQPLLLGIGAGLQEPVADRLVERGLIRRESKRVLGLFRTTTLPGGDPRHEADLRRKIRSALEGTESPAAHRSSDRAAFIQRHPAESAARSAMVARGRQAGEGDRERQLGGLGREHGSDSRRRSGRRPRCHHRPHHSPVGGQRQHHGTSGGSLRTTGGGVVRRSIS